MNSTAPHQKMRRNSQQLRRVQLRLQPASATQRQPTTTRQDARRPHSPAPTKLQGCAHVPYGTHPYLPLGTARWVLAIIYRFGQSAHMSAIAYEDVEELLRKAVPEFAPAIDEHVDFNEGFLSHVLFGDLTRFVMDAYARGETEVLHRTLTFLDQAIRHGDERVQNLISVSVVENVEPWDPNQWTFIASWPDALLRDAENHRDWYQTRT